jgi:hypothetical protein
MRLVKSRQAAKQERAEKIHALKKDLEGWLVCQRFEKNESIDIIVAHTRAKLAELGA